MTLSESAIERGTAAGTTYRAIAGDCYSAEIVERRADGTVDIDVIVPGCAERVRLRKIRWRDHDEAAATS